MTFRANAGLSVDEEVATDRSPPSGCQDNQRIACSGLELKVQW